MMGGVGEESQRRTPVSRLARPWRAAAVLALGLVALLVTPALSQGVTHVVRPGDSLGLIAETYGTTIGAIADANGLVSFDLIWVGQELTIPLGDVTGDEGEDSASPAFHVVGLGDTLADIAYSHGISLASLIAANGITDVDMLYVGQRLLIPGAEGPAPTPTPFTSTPVPEEVVPTATPEPRSTQVVATLMPTPAPTSTLEVARPGIAGPGTRPAVVAGTFTPKTTSQPPTPEATATPALTPTPATHIVQPGETLGQIATKYGTTAAALARLNGLTSPDLVYVGIELRIPVKEWTAPLYPGKANRFVASISQQRCWLYQGNVVIGDWLCSTGQPGTVTVPGTYAVQSKMDKAWGSTWNFWMPYWLGIYWAGASENGIHGLPYDADSGWRLWEGLVGTPVTYGCILLDDKNAKILYDMAYIGMPVIIQP